MSADSVIVPFSPTHPDQALEFARLVEETGARRLWFGQCLALEPHQLMAYIAGAGVRVSCGTAVAVAPLRSPYEEFLHARSLAALTGLPFVAGVGPSGPELVAALRGEPYARPRTAMAEYLKVLGQLRDDGAANVAGEYHRVRANVAPLEHERVEIGAGVLRPAMARTAGEFADVAITWLTPPEYLADKLIPALRAGAEAAGRPVPRVATVVHVALAGPDRDPRHLAVLANAQHLAAEHYRDALRHAGITLDPADPAAALLNAGLFVHGGGSEVAEGLRRYREAGVDEVILNVAGVLCTEGIDAALGDLRALLTA
ncbi:LLM class flavin-dependent oxidoreductase [Allokutzneria sp. NRRL B-24872]|uniref:LLM class flavin-dependent oxidoreductase n=1 Tax=Allokutzneria sp. NRRL B-24872 TaxID=1137961 RepID=UPI000A363508|nr:LLM class flavin-dependent oxidoreductase [Allokutzneria sp. NRRL B-24872]